MSDQPTEPTQPQDQPQEPSREPKAGDVVTYEVENPYHDEGPRVDTHAGLVVQAGDGRVRVVDLGPVDRSADFPADAVQLAD